MTKIENYYSLQSTLFISFYISEKNVKSIQKFD